MASKIFVSTAFVLLLSHFMGEDTPKRRKIFLESIPLGRFSKPQDIVNTVAFLASDDAEFLTSLDLEVDSGRCIYLKIQD